MQHSKRQRRDYTNPYMISNLMPVLVSILKSHAGLIAFPSIVEEGNNTTKWDWQGHVVLSAIREDKEKYLTGTRKIDETDSEGG